MIITIKRKLFTDKPRNNKKGGKNKKYNNRKGSGNTINIPKEILENISDGEKEAQERLEDLKGKRRKRRRLERIYARQQAKVDEVDLRIATENKKNELKNKESILNDLRHPNPPKPQPDAPKPQPDDRGTADKIKDSLKEKLNDPKVKKTLKTAGLITLGTAAATGAGYGIYKLARKHKEKKENEKIKNSMLKEDEKE